MFSPIWFLITGVFWKLRVDRERLTTTANNSRAFYVVSLTVVKQLGRIMLIAGFVHTFLAQFSFFCVLVTCLSCRGLRAHKQWSSVCLYCAWSVLSIKPWLDVDDLKFSQINFPVLWLLHFNVFSPKQTKSCFWEAETG